MAIRAAGVLATKAVLAVPELRWAEVDVLVREQSESGSGRVRAIVEGLTMRPQIDTSLHTLAGSLDVVLDRVVRGGWSTTIVS